MIQVVWISAGRLLKKGRALSILDQPEVVHLTRGRVDLQKMPCGVAILEARIVVLLAYGVDPVVLHVVGQRVVHPVGGLADRGKSTATLDLQVELCARVSRLATIRRGRHVNSRALIEFVLGELSGRFTGCRLLTLTRHGHNAINLDRVIVTLCRRRIRQHL